MARKVLALFALLMATTLPAQFSLQLEQGITLSEDVNYKPVGIGLNYQVVSWKGFEFSIGLAFDQVTILADLPLAGEPRTCSGFFYFCNYDNSKLKSYESRIFIPLRVEHRTGRFTYGLELRPGFRIHNTIDFTRPVFESNSYDDSRTISGRYGRSIPISDNQRATFTVNTKKFRVQLGANLSYHLSKRLSFGFNYRYEGFVNEAIEVLFTPSPWARPVASPPFYSRGRSRVHYLVGMVGWKL